MGNPGSSAVHVSSDPTEGIEILKYLVSTLLTNKINIYISLTFHMSTNCLFKFCLFKF